MKSTIDAAVENLISRSGEVLCDCGHPDYLHNASQLAPCHGGTPATCKCMGFSQVRQTEFLGTQAKRNRAVEKYLESPLFDARDPIDAQARVRAFEYGWDAARAEPPWTPISDESSLPKVEHTY